jgi:diadenosine tetraphosphatase ApaH/serine/threonine PP2A family protein phosphatase
VIAVISDIHGNLEALEATLEDARREGATKLICLGDIVGYGADPNGCVERVHKVVSACVLGNHDAATLDEKGAENFNAVARAAIQWTREQMTPKNMAVLRGTPLEHAEDGALFVHSSPENPLAWNYVLTETDARAAFDSFDENVCFIGHSHVPFRILMLDGDIEVVRDPELVIPEGGRALINVGSVGQPRDGDWRAAYALYDSQGARVIARRVEYDCQGAASKILAAGLPEILARRLALGR